MSAEVLPLSLIRRASDASGLDGLDRAGRRLARGLGEFLTALLSLPASVAALPATLEAGVPALDGQAVRAIRLAPLPGAMLLAVGPAAAARLTDRHYGGEGADVPASEALSPAAERVVDRLARGLCGLLPPAWRPLAPVTAELQGDAGEPEPGAVARQTFAIACEGWSELAIDCFYPLAMIEAGAAPAIASPANEAGWQASLMESALHLPFRVRAVFAEPELRLARLAALRPGDMIPICLPATISLRIDDAVIACGAAGESNGRAAVRIERP